MNVKSIMNNILLYLNLNSDLLSLLFTTLIFLIFIHVTKKIIIKIANIKPDNKTRYRYKKKINLTFTIIIIFFLTIMWSSYINNLITLISFLSAAMAIALREIIFNIFCGFFIKIKKPFEVEDRIEINNIRGDVININLMNFEVLEVDEKNLYTGQSTGIIITIPNSMLFSHSLKNFNKIFKYIWNEMIIKIPVDFNISQAKKTIYKIVNSNEIINKIPTKMRNKMENIDSNYRIYYNNYDPMIYTKVVDDYIELTVRYLIHPKKVRYVESSIWEQLLKANNENEIKLYNTSKGSDENE